MDKSEAYIKMCGKAEEIQALRDDNKSHQFFCCKICGLIASEDTGSYWVYCDCTPSNTELFWLPRQDQLQEMVGFSCVGNAIANIADFAHFHTGDSMEQLWLAFVMREKYGKAWKGEDWAKVE